MEGEHFGASLLVILLLGLLTLALLLWLSFPAVEKGTVAFFHPFADGGGGGERVLWCAVKAVLEAAPHVRVVIYVRDEAPSTHQLLADAAHRFNISVPAAADAAAAARPPPQQQQQQQQQSKGDLTAAAQGKSLSGAANGPTGTHKDLIRVVRLKRSRLLLPKTYPRFTLLGQALGSMAVALEALGKLVPELFIDTTGWAFTYPIAAAAGAKVAAYTHYPTVSTNMIGRLWQRNVDFNNDASIAGSWFMTSAKALYYNTFALVYGAAGGCAHATLVNSSWTQRHIESLWWGGRPIYRVYPPCDTQDLQTLPLDRRLKQLYLISVAQFRPEKNHRLQLEAFAAAKQKAGDPSLSPFSAFALRAARLKMVGSCRNDVDAALLSDLQAQARELGLEGYVDWHINVSYAELRELLGGAVGGLHTMVDEHFGISVVEYMAAGVIPIAHNSAGPREDIIVPLTLASNGVGGFLPPDDFAAPQPPNGFLATSLQEFTDAIFQVPSYQL
uniref:GDP-Man:Man(3)GlcNAc(2)-PP-Dol alpha-1,2-mannosyltransferase n=1 Tax=Dunaliella tertiolecta TaxID=3047 RepID=A0A7S3QMY8_DUNTE